MPFELTYADDNNQFLYYNNAHQDPDTMFAKRVPPQSGSRMSTRSRLTSTSSYENVEWVIGTLRNGNQEYVRTIVPGSPEGVINTHNYQAMYYDDGSYAGINEIVFNFKPWLDWYLETTGQRLVGGSGPFAPLQLVMAVATPHLEHQMPVVMVATQLQPQMPHLEHPHIKTWKSWDNCPNFFMVILDSFSLELAHLPCSKPHILEVKPMSQFQRKKYWPLVLKKKLSLLTKVWGRYALRSMLAGSFYLTMSTAVGIIGADVIATGIPALSRFVSLPLSLPSDWSSFSYSMESWLLQT